MSPLLSPPPPGGARNSSRGRAATRSASPPSQPQSKRDKRRTMLSDKLSDMVASFSSNHFEHYYAQLSALQCDINLVMRADPYRQGPLDDSKEDIDRAVAAAREEICRARPISADAESSFTALAGQFYSKFVNDINTALEERDSDLTLLYQQYTDGMEELQRTNQYKRQLAHEEHALLSKTLRERLIQTVTQKRAKLLRDKEQLDIADSNALLLNPTQFSIGNPASPGGIHSSRKTRHTRGRPGETGGGDDSAADSKRKRKAPYDDADSGSPGPSAGIPDLTSNGTAHRDVRAKLMQSQFEAPLYSVDRLFTEKELALNLNRAHYQTTEYFTKLRNSGLENRLHAAANAINSANSANVTNGSLGDRDASANGTADGADASNAADEDAGQASTGDSPPQAPAQPIHATRAAQRANPTSSLADLASLSTSLSQTRTGVGMGMPMAMAMGNLMPPYSINISTSASKTNATAPLLGGLPEAEAVSDLLIMKRGADDPHWEKLAELCVEKPGAPPAVPESVAATATTLDRAAEPPAPAQETAATGSAAAAAAAAAATPTAANVATAAVSAPAMGRSQSGTGQAMRRTASSGGSGLGGTDMRRTTSAAGFGGATRGRR